MASQRQYRTWTIVVGQRASAGRVLTAILLAVVATLAAHAQTFNVIYNVPGQLGGEPWSGVTMDRSGNLFGTTFYGGNGHGSVYKVTHSGSGWVASVLYTFTGGTDGAYPYAGITIGPDGALYGTTYGGGGTGCGYGCGTVYRLHPPASFCRTAICSWTETVLYRFTGGPDGRAPYAGIAFDQAGNLYGTTLAGGLSTCNGGFGCGVVYRLASSGGSWTQTVLHSFAGGNDGAAPRAGLVLDSSGRLYGTTAQGGRSGQGIVFQLASSGSSWTENVLYSFTGAGDGGGPIAGLIFDSLGNLYGATANGGSGLCKVFELTPAGSAWSFALLYSFTYLEGANCAASLTLDGAGNLYGTSAGGGTFANGVVFKLTPSGGAWTYSALHEFTGGSDGEDLYSTPVLDALGNVYATASLGGGAGGGTVFQIAP